MIRQRAVAPRGDGPNLPKVSAESVATDRLRDLRVTVRNNSLEANFEELGKIGGAFATSYRIPRYRFTYKFPNRLRVDGSAGPLSATLLYVDNKKTVRIPLSTTTKDTTGKPGQKQSLMDVGIFSRDWLALDYDAVYQRREKGLIVFRLNQRLTDNPSHEIVWVNPRTSITERRISIDGKGALVKEIRYMAPREVAKGIWIPTRVEIYNQFGKRGAVQEVEEIVVNQGVPDSEFVL